jgi:hypothetical protein
MLDPLDIPHARRSSTSTDSTSTSTIVVETRENPDLDDRGSLSRDAMGVRERRVP